LTTIQNDGGREPLNARIVAFGAIAGQVAMVVLATIIISQFRAVQLRDAGDIGSAYIQGFLTPYAQEAHDDGQLSILKRTELLRLVGSFASERRFDAIRIRAKDGAVLFASDSEAEVLAESPEEFLQATRGLILVDIHPPTNDSGLHSYPTVEIYAPIYDQTTKQLIAVGEIYQDARPLLTERAEFERTVWGAVGLATLGFLAIMFVLARQHRQMVLHLETQREIAVQNQQLHEAADTAWRTSGQVHEALLNHLGAELHDGPIQMLSLLALMKQPDSSAGATPGPSAQEIARDVLADLRRISAGLTLPELGHLSVRETLMLAITRHANATGTDVAHDFGPLPDSADDQRKTCLYRIVQEGLNNAFHHGGGFGQRVTARMENNAIYVAVVNDGNGPPETVTDATPARNAGLGVIGLRNRLKVFGGTLDAERLHGGGFVLAAQLPLV
jgi:signal transduction histidine kinase